MVPSWHAINFAIWLFAILLQAVLATLVVMRGLPARYPAFTTLIVFYPIRAALLFALTRFAGADAVEVWSAILSWIAVLLEAWLLIELAAALFRDASRTRYSPILVWIAATLACTWITLDLVPGRVELDRTQVFFWWAMLGWAAAGIVWSRASNLLRIGIGFAAFSLAQLITLAGRAHAWRARNSHAYIGWSYVPVGVYIAVVAWWLLFLRREPPAPATVIAPTGSTLG